MIDNWLNYQEAGPKPNFSVIIVSEKQIIDNEGKAALLREILNSYRDIDFLKHNYLTEQPVKLVDYLNNEILPQMGDPFGVWQGDLGETLGSMIVSCFLNLAVPLKKMRWKFNKDRSVFCTDMIAHNQGNDITDLYYYEIKTRRELNKKESRDGSSSYITIHAHNSLLKDKNSPTEGIIDFLSRYYYEKGDLNSSSKYHHIIINPGSYNKKFELFFIGEKKSFSESILDDLNTLPPQLSPLNVTVVLIDGFGSLVSDLRATITLEAENIVYKS